MRKLNKRRESYFRGRIYPAHWAQATQYTCVSDTFINTNTNTCENTNTNTCDSKYTNTQIHIHKHKYKYMWLQMLNTNVMWKFEAVAPFVSSIYLIYTICICELNYSNSIPCAVIHSTIKDRNQNRQATDHIPTELDLATLWSLATFWSIYILKHFTIQTNVFEMFNPFWTQVLIVINVKRVWNSQGITCHQCASSLFFDESFNMWVCEFVIFIDHFYLILWFTQAW